MILAVLAVLMGTTTFAQDAAPTATFTPPPAKPIAKWVVSKVPWDEWFKKNNIVTDKMGYIHLFWDAQDFKMNFEVKDKQNRLADAAIQLVARLYPSDAKADLMKVDIVYVLERDRYGEPKWDSLQQVAHLEFSRSKAMKLMKHKGPLSASQMKKLFDKFEIY